MSATGVVFGVETDVPRVGGNAAQRREHDKRIGGGTMSRTGATCPCCGVIMTMEDIRLEGRAGRLGAVMTASLWSTDQKERNTGCRRSTSTLWRTCQRRTCRRFTPTSCFGIPEEPTPTKTQFSGVYNYGFDTWRKLFTSRQLAALATFLEIPQAAMSTIDLANYKSGYVGGKHRSILSIDV